MPLPPNPIAFTIPYLNRPVFWYGLMVTFGTLAGAIVADREARRRGQNPDHVWNALIPVMIFGLLGARLYHVISQPAGGTTSLQTYLADPMSIISFWNGGLRGLGIFGAIVGGIFGLWFYCNTYPFWVKLQHRLTSVWVRLQSGLTPRSRRSSLDALDAPQPVEEVPHKLNFVAWADICVVGVPLGQAIGRWGNYFNQELYGNPTTLPWGVPVAPEYRLPQFANLPPTTTFHPSFLYESLWNLLVFFLLGYIAHRWDDRLRTGDLVLLYFILYPLGRFFVELQRPDAWTVGGIPVAQLISVGAIFLASLALLLRHRARRTGPLAVVEA